MITIFFIWRYTVQKLFQHTIRFIKSCLLRILDKIVHWQLRAKSILPCTPNRYGTTTKTSVIWNNTTVRIIALVASMYTGTTGTATANTTDKTISFSSPSYLLRCNCKIGWVAPTVGTSMVSVSKNVNCNYYSTQHLLLTIAHSFRVYIALSKQEEGWENSSFENSPTPPSVKMRLCKHRKSALLVYQIIFKIRANLKRHNRVYIL